MILQHIMGTLYVFSEEIGGKMQACLEKNKSIRKESKKKIIRAKTAGFCMGVARALRMLDATVSGKNNCGKNDTQVVTLGPIIHNGQVLEEYEKKNVYAVDKETVRNIYSTQSIVVRAHGIPRELEHELRSRQNITLVDATCPKVKEAQNSIAELASQGYFILIFGEFSHAEVQGLCSYAEDSVAVLETIEAVKTFPYKRDRRYALVAQTTQSIVAFQEAYRWIQCNASVECVCVNTICDATWLRQEEVESIAQQVDIMIIVGGRTSGNTRRLCAIAERYVPVIHIETATELNTQQLIEYSSIGLSAGASTPCAHIDAVHALLNTL